MKVLAAILFASCLATAVQAGSPITKQMTCPIGGEVFDITTTASCSVMGRTLSQRPITSCDFVTRLPICPSNGLPVFDDFDEAQLSALEDLLSSAAWQEMKDLPPFQRASAVAAHLGLVGSELTFGLSLSSLWYETEAFVTSPAAQTTFVSEAEAELARAEEGTAGYVRAIVAFGLGLAGKTEEARGWLADVAPGDDEYLAAYVTKVAACLEDMSEPSCNPGARFDADAQ